MESPLERVVGSLTAVADLSPDQQQEVDAIVTVLHGAEEAAHSETTPEARARLEGQIRREGEKALATVLDEDQKEHVRRYLENRRIYGRR